MVFHTYVVCILFFQEFIRVGYYVSNEYSDPELQETPPETPNFDKLTRNILASNPRVTKFKINWDDPSKVRKIDFIQYTLPFFGIYLSLLIFPLIFSSQMKTEKLLKMLPIVMPWKKIAIVVQQILISTKTNLQLVIPMLYLPPRIPCLLHHSSLDCLLESPV